VMGTQLHGIHIRTTQTEEDYHKIVATRAYIAQTGPCILHRSFREPSLDPGVITAPRSQQ
jgi:hypothetical protein